MRDERQEKRKSIQYKAKSDQKQRYTNSTWNVREEKMKSLNQNSMTQHRALIASPMTE